MSKFEWYKFSQDFYYEHDLLYKNRPSWAMQPSHSSGTFLQPRVGQSATSRLIQTDYRHDGVERRQRMINMRP